PPLAFPGDVILLMYLFLLGTFFLALAGLDAGSAFGGMGSSREVAVAALAEPTIIVAVFALAMRAEPIDLARVVERFGRAPLLANLFFPWGAGSLTGPAAIPLGVLVLAGKLVLLVIALAVLETTVAKLRLFRVPELLAGSFALAILSVMAVVLV